MPRRRQTRRQRQLGDAKKTADDAQGKGKRRTTKGRRGAEEG